MKREELTIGDWVCFKLIDEGKWQVYQIEDGVILYDGAEDARPVPLTQEILDMNGFKRHEWEHDNFEWDGYRIRACKNSPGFDCVISNTVNGYPRTVDAHIDYVHELQHILRFCGFDIEIRLNTDEPIILA